MGRKIYSRSVEDLAGLKHMIPFIIWLLHNNKICSRLKRLRTVTTYNLSIYLHVDFIDIEFFVYGLASVYCNRCLFQRQFSHSSVKSIETEVLLHLNKACNE